MAAETRASQIVAEARMGEYREADVPKERHAALYHLYRVNCKGDRTMFEMIQLE